jgi:IS605 OrfB family transposase
MKLVAQVKLQPTPQQAQLLQRTMERANQACNHLSQQAWETKTFGRYALHKLAYHDTRAHFPDLSSQVVVRCIAKVSDAYKQDRKHKRCFRAQGAIAYDGRILSWKSEGEQEVSIWTVGGRQRMSYGCGEGQRVLLAQRGGQADLVYREGAFYLHQSCQVETADGEVPEQWLGVDLGIVHVAVTSDGESFSGEQIEAKRVGYARRRQVLQSVGSRSAKRRLRQLSGRQARYQRDTNHCISKVLVEVAQRTGRGIALEDLSGIGERTRVRREQRHQHDNWSFYQLRQFVSYKAVLAGVAVQLVDPRYSSQTCSVCGHCERSNRPTRDEFVCSVCGYAAPADENAARVIARRACVNAPMVSTEAAKAAPGPLAQGQRRDGEPSPATAPSCALSAGQAAGQGQAPPQAAG